MVYGCAFSRLGDAHLAQDAAQEAALAYQMPTQVLADMIDAPPTPGVYLSPDKEWLVLLERPTGPADELARATVESFWGHAPALLFGFGIVLEQKRGRRY